MPELERVSQQGQSRTPSATDQGLRVLQVNLRSYHKQTLPSITKTKEDGVKVINLETG